MPRFYGGDTMTAEYDFGTSVAGDVNSVVKAYTASIDTNSIPSPLNADNSVNSNIYKEVTSQKILDVLKVQDGNTIVEQTLNSVNGFIVNHNSPCDGFINVDLQGNTLKNELNYNPATWAEWTNKSIGYIIDGTGAIEYTTNNEAKSLKIPIMAKPLTKYGILFNIISNSVNTTFYSKLAGKLIPSNAITINSNETGNKKFIDVTLDTITDSTFIIGMNNLGSGSIKLKDFRIFELPSGSQIEIDFNTLTADQLCAKYQFFSGLKGVGEKQADGQYKVEVLSKSKNLFDKSNAIMDGKRINENNGNYATDSNGEGHTDYIQIKPNTSYVFSGIGNHAYIPYALYDVNKNYIGGGSTPTIPIKLFTNTFYIRFSLFNENLNTLQFEENSRSTTYELYKEDKVNILIPKELGIESKISGDTVTYADKTTYKLPKPLTLSCFKSGSLTINCGSIPPFIKESHQSGTDDNGVATYSSSITGLSQCYLFQIALLPICRDIYSDSLLALKSAYKITSNFDIWAYGSGNGGNNATYKVWNGTSWDIAGANTSNIVSKTNCVMNKSDYVATDKKVYVLVCANPASDSVQSVLNLDYFSVKIDLSKVADKYLYAGKEYMEYTLSDKWVIIVKGLVFSTTKKPKPLIIGTTEIDLTTLVTDKKFQCNNIVIQQNGTNITLSVLNNADAVIKKKVINKVITGYQQIKILSNDFFIEKNLNVFNDKNFSDTDIENILHSSYPGFTNSNIPTGYILPNNVYKITGQAKLYINNYYTRTVQDCTFTTNNRENKIELIGSASCVRVD